MTCCDAHFRRRHGAPAAGLALVAGIAAALSLTPAAQADSVIDLTHPIPTFKPMDGDPMKPDLSQPYEDIGLHPSFGAQAVFALGTFPTSDGHFDLGTLVLAEHHGTHLDTSAHYVNNDASLEAAGMPAAERKHAHELTAADLTGRMVMIDISGRVMSELEKNGGRPSPDTSVTDFSNNSPNVVGPDDIEAVADDLEDGVWLVLNLGWSRFFFEGPDFAEDPYINGWNHPGINKAAVDRLIELMEEKDIRIKGIIADNIGIDSGESAIGIDDKWTDSWHAHVRLLQRGLLFVENAANLDQLAQVDDGEDCLIAVGAPRHVHGTGGPSRVMAICD